MAQTLSSTPQSPTDQVQSAAPARVCMHVLGRVRIDARVLREADALVKTGMAVSIVDVEAQRTYPREEDFQGIRLKHVRMPSWFVPTRRFKLWFLVKAFQLFCRGTFALLRTSADVYHAQDTKALPACCIAAWLRRKPLIFDAHELPLVEQGVTRWRRLHALATRAFRWMIPRCIAVITVSPPIAQELQRRYGGPTPVLIRNMPNYQSPISSDRLRRQLGLSPQTQIALYQGNLQPNRGLDRLVYAAKFLDPGVVIVMMGRNVMDIDLEALIAQEGVADRVKVLPPVPYEELLEWTASADIGLTLFDPGYSFSIRMCLPNKLFEYLMAGLPVLASSLDAVADVLKTYDVGVVAPSLEPAEIGEAINRLLADSAALARMRKNALAAAQKDLRWDVESQRLLQLYQQVLGSFDKG
ncbi:MAG TPA: glycosyltransferase family 4 protein [Ktedonobacterales bacterium]|jgi:glycosyltransferase involved in cell wall biosynthesis